MSEFNGPIHAQLRNGPGRQCSIECYVNGTRSVQYGGINSGHMAGDDAVVGVDFGRLPDENVVGLGFSDLEGGFELAGIDDLGDGGAGGDVHSNRHGGGQGGHDAGDAGFYLKVGLLLLIQVEQGAGGVNFGLL